MNHTRQKSFIILESTRKYYYEVIKNISYTTGQSHTQKSSTSFNFLYLEAIIFIHADNVGNGLFKTQPFFFLFLLLPILFVVFHFVFPYLSFFLLSHLFHLLVFSVLFPLIFLVLIALFLNTLLLLHPGRGFLRFASD